MSVFTKVFEIPTSVRTSVIKYRFPTSVMTTDVIGNDIDVGISISTDNDVGIYIGTDYDVGVHIGSDYDVGIRIGSDADVGINIGSAGERRY